LLVLLGSDLRDGVLVDKLAVNRYVTSIEYDMLAVGLGYIFRNDDNGSAKAINVSENTLYLA
jgi:hypothetical protein